jgi:hypothetical protein
MKKSDTGENKTLIGLLRRATAVINEETQLLIDAPNADVSGIVARKNRYLFELSIAMEDTKIGPDDDKVLSALKNLKEAADRNERRLAAQIDAAREIVGILGNLAQANAKDGTYAAHRSF